MPRREPYVSALLPVHREVAVESLRAALESLLAQTYVPDEIVIVEDGALEPGHREALADVEGRHPCVIRIRLPVNRGAGVANQTGLAAASGTWIAKFDADDICLPHRIERQLAALEGSGADVCGSAMLEFVEDPASPVALRTSPLAHADIARRMRFNNPINHPSAMYRRELAMAVGGYADLRYMQDYDLFARLLAAGAEMINLEEPLVLFRANEGMRRRRSARELTTLEWQLQGRLHAYGLVGRPRMLANLVVRMTFRKLPAPLMRLAYRRLLSRRLEPVLHVQGRGGHA